MLKDVPSCGLCRHGFPETLESIREPVNDMSIALSQPVSWSSPQPLTDYGYLQRSIYLPLPFLLPVVLAGMSILLQGSPVLTDLAFLTLTGLCIIFLASEFIVFSRRFGIGGMVLFGGVLLWFCYDYLYHWLGINFRDPSVEMRPIVLARSTFYHCLFVLIMTMGLLIPGGKWLERWFQIIPEPGSGTFYFWAVLFLFAVGISPYLLFTDEPWYQAIWADLTGGRTAGASWTVGRTGNVNYSWGAYVATLMQMGQVGGQLGVFYALLVARRPAAKAVGLATWLFWIAIAFGSGTRGYLVFMALPGIALLFLKYQAYAAVYFQRISKAGYTRAIVLTIVLLFAIQFQAYFRDKTYGGADVSEVSLVQLRGTSMFSEGLLGFAMIPQDANYFYNRIPGETLLRPIPQTLYEFVIGPIPRAWWTSKPIDPAWRWYNAVATGDDEGITGTTVAQGLVGGWYFRYGPLGVIQGALLMGWLLAVSERALQNAQGRPIVILLSLAFATWLFRCYRLFNFHELYPLLIGAVGLWAVVRLQRATSRTI